MNNHCTSCYSGKWKLNKCITASDHFLKQFNFARESLLMYKGNVHGWKLGETVFKMWISAVSNFIAIIPFFFNLSTVATFSVVDSLRTVSKFRKIKIKSSSCFSVLHKTRNYKISRRNRSVTAVKCIVVVLVMNNNKTKTGSTSKTTLHVHHTF